MDLTFLIGVGAVISAIIVFCGSVWLLLTMVMGARLAYFVTASVTLGFLLIMGVVWSISPLGPTGPLPEWQSVDIGEDPGELRFEPAAEYPEGPWREPDQEDPLDLTKATELEAEATDYLEQSINEGSVDAFQAIDEATINSDATRLLDQGDGYGAVTFEPSDPGKQGRTVVAMLQYDPGNPLGPARRITAGILVLFAGHLFGLARSEKRARRRLAEVPG